MLKSTALAVVVGLGVAWSASAVAQETLKIGVILPYSGPFADAANQLQAGIDLYIAEHGDEVAGRKIELIKRDTGGKDDLGNAIGFHVRFSVAVIDRAGTTAFPHRQNTRRVRRKYGGNQQKL